MRVSCKAPVRRPASPPGLPLIHAEYCGKPVAGRAVLLVLLFFSFTLCSCGYRVLSNQGAVSFSSMHVAGVQNRTHEPGLEDMLHQALVEELLIDRRVGLVDEKGADVLLESTVTGFMLRPTAESDSRVTQYEIELRGDFLLIDGKTGHKVMEIRNLQAPIRITFTVGSNVRDARVNQERAETIACRSLARELASRVLLN